MNEIVVGVIGLIGTISSVSFAYLAFRRNRTTDTKRDAKTEGVLISDIGYIKSSIDRMEGKLDKVETNYQDLLSRLVRVEEAQSSLEKRLEHSNLKDKYGMMSIPVITILCYLIGEFFKVVILRKKKRYKYIPTIVGGIGGMLGLIIYYVSPDLLFNVTSPFLAVAIGITSGLASTGGNELIKQIIKKREKEDAS